MGGFNNYIIMLYAWLETVITVKHGNCNEVRKSLYTGNPVSCAVTFHLFVMPCLWKMSGWKDPHHNEITVKVHI